jgi:hypothetical protein
LQRFYGYKRPYIVYTITHLNNDILHSIATLKK